MVPSRLACLIALALPLVACGGADEGATVPVLDTVMPMIGVLHVEWSASTTCDTIEAERKDPTHAYAVAFSVSGTETSHMDSGASADMMYTYRLRCKMGETYSAYSNEKSANPTQM
jgi:hypothetical protein